MESLHEAVFWSIDVLFVGDGAGARCRIAVCALFTASFLTDRTRSCPPGGSHAGIAVISPRTVLERWGRGELLGRRAALHRAAEVSAVCHGVVWCGVVCCVLLCCVVLCCVVLCYVIAFYRVLSRVGGVVNLL